MISSVHVVPSLIKFWPLLFPHPRSLSLIPFPSLSLSQSPLHPPSLSFPPSLSPSLSPPIPLALSSLKLCTSLRTHFARLLLPSSCAKSLRVGSWRNCTPSSSSSSSSLSSPLAPPLSTINTSSLLSLSQYSSSAINATPLSSSDLFDELTAAPSQKPYDYFHFFSRQLFIPCGGDEGEPPRSLLAPPPPVTHGIIFVHLPTLLKAQGTIYSRVVRYSLD